MKTLYYIDTQEAADALPKVIAGTNRNTDIGLHVHVPTPNKIILPHNVLSIENVFIPVMKTGYGEFEFKDIRTSEFGGDNFNIRGNGNVKGNKLRAWRNTPTRPYGLCIRKGNETVEECLDRHGEVVYDPSLLSFEMWKGKESIIGYHVDGILQVYATPSVGYPAYDEENRDPEGGYGSISNIDIAHIDADLHGTKTQGIAGTERCSYSNIRIGYDSFRVITDGYPYHTLFNTLEDSSIGCEAGNQTAAKLWISQSKGTTNRVANNVYPGFEPNQIVGDVGTMKSEQFESNVKEPSLPSFTVIPHDLSIAQFAFEHNVEPAKLEAFVDVESKGDTHLDGRVLKLQEPHVLWRQLDKEGIDPEAVLASNTEFHKVLQPKPRKRGTYGSSSSQNAKFDLACEVSLPAAIMSCSWGFAQLLGENWEMCGFTSPEDFRNGMQSRRGQLYGFLNYLANREGLMGALRMGDWEKVTDLYNGTGFYDGDKNGLNDYTEKLMKAYTRRVLQKAPNRTQSNSYAKSRTKKKLRTDAVLTGSSGVVSLGLAGWNYTLNKVQEIKEGAVAVGEQAQGILASIGASISMTTILAFLGGILLTTLYFKLKAARHYDEDNGYTTLKGIFDEYRS